MSYTLTKEKLTKLLNVPKSQQKRILKTIGSLEFARCAEDVLYWLDESKHPGIPYVYTKDPHAMFHCLICKDTATYHFNNRHRHLEMRHEIEVEDEKAIRGYFVELPRTRPFTLMPYMVPIIEAWLKYPLFAVEKSRDMMATWITVALYTWDTIFHQGRENIFQSENGKKTQDLVSRAYFMWQNQPKFLRDQHRADFSQGQNKAGRLYLPTLDSEIFGLPQGSDQIRMYHPSGLYSDEAAFQDGAGDCFAAVKPSIQNGGRYTAVSSANPSFFMHLTKDTLENVE